MSPPSPKEILNKHCLSSFSSEVVNKIGSRFQGMGLMSLISASPPLGLAFALKAATLSFSSARPRYDLEKGQAC